MIHSSGTCTLYSNILHAHMQAGSSAIERRTKYILCAMCVGGVTLAIPILPLFSRPFDVRMHNKCSCVFEFRQIVIRMSY